MNHSALIVGDLNAAIQKIVKNPYPHAWDEIEKNNRLLMSAFLSEARPVYQTSVQPKFLPKRWSKAFGRQLISEIKGTLEVVKFGPSVMTKSDFQLAAHLKAQGITRLYFSGISTSNGVFKSAKDAAALGFEVVLICDATADKNASAYEKIIQEEFPKIGKIKSTKEVLAQRSDSAD
ncbi:isochorismatase family protein [Lactococcus hircilactis]|uniref:Isochorismatase family protein n=1 Tax=Lactococcus hircilactis TaxID=1494462 RepID=A0A7X1Z736_9LACT|nr:isochorismatase family protein [Lactococcus hircilactis]MQW38853.1 isochorismatase family protein [Lactococcus hircilactis]